jgi:hypothetical protein
VDHQMQKLLHFCLESHLLVRCAHGVHKKSGKWKEKRATPSACARMNL